MGSRRSEPGEESPQVFPWGAVIRKAASPWRVVGDSSDLQAGVKRAGQELRPLLSTQPGQHGNCTWPGWGAEPHSGSDSPGIARLPTCAQRRCEREYAFHPTPWPATPRPSLPLKGRGMLHPPARRLKRGNPRIFRMPPETFFLINQGPRKEVKRLERGLRVKTHSHPLSIARERWRKVEPEDTEAESPRLAAPPAAQYSTDSTAAPTPQMQN